MLVPTPWMSMLLGPLSETISNVSWRDCAFPVGRCPMCYKEEESDGQSRPEPNRMQLHRRRTPAPEPRVRPDRIGAVPRRQLFLEDRAIDLVVQGLDILKIELEPDLVIDI